MSRLLLRAGWKAALLISLSILVPGLAVLAAPPAQGPAPTSPFAPAQALHRLRQMQGDVQVEWDRASGAPAFLGGRLSPPGGLSAPQAAVAFFDRYRDLYGLSPPLDELELVASKQDRLGYSGVRFRQRAAGLPVFDTDIRVHFDRQGAITSIHGRILPLVAITTTRPALDSGEALAVAQAHLGARGQIQQEPVLGIARIGGQDHLAFQLLTFAERPLGRWRYTVDALDGSVLEWKNLLAFDRERQTFDARNTGVLPGVLKRSEGQGPSGDAILDAAHDHAGEVYDYFEERFNRDSLDDDGMALRSTVHYDEGFNNAFWNGSQMVYGDGDGELFAPLALALDVVAHELTHGLTQETADLFYYGQSGALNESYSDLFGAMVDPDWDIGEDVYTPGLAGDALRSMSDPLRYGNPSHMHEYLDISRDQGGVHINSSIPNHIAQLIADRIGRPKTEQIYHRTLTEKLTRFSSFSTAALLTVASCNDLIGSHQITEADCRTVQNTFALQGIGTPVLAPPGDGARQLYLPLVRDRVRSCSGSPQLLTNGGFESGEKPWANSGTIIAAWPTAPKRSGSGVAWLAGYTGAEDTMLQRVPVPEGATTLQVRFWYYVDAADGGSSGGDRLVVRIEDGPTLAPIGAGVIVDSSSQSQGGWKELVFTVPVSGRRSVRLFFQGTTGSGGATSFFVDDVSVVPVCDGESPDVVANEAGSPTLPAVPFATKTVEPEPLPAAVDSELHLRDGLK